MFSRITILVTTIIFVVLRLSKLIINDYIRVYFNQCILNFKLKIFLCALFLVGVSMIPVEKSYAQGKKKVIQLSGIILGEDSISGVPGVHVYVPKAGRGTSTNNVGYFSMPVLVGDSVVISSIGYKKKFFIVPDNEGDRITIIEELDSDVTYLETVQVLPFPTERLFKEAILAMNTPEDNGINKDNFDAEFLAYMLANTAMGPEANHTYYMNNFAYQQHNRYTVRSNPLLNPFAWAQLIKSIKRGDFKKKK